MNVIVHALQNPYVYSSAIMAQLCTIAATMLWGVLIVVFPDAMGSNPNYTLLLELCPYEDVWGVGVMLVAAITCWRVCTHHSPMVFGVVGHGLLALLWTYLWWGLIMGDRLWPTGISSATILMVLSVYAFIANPKRR